jgi:hypothetical protein
MQHFSLEQGNAPFVLAPLYAIDWNDFNMPAKSNFYLVINIKTEKSSALYASLKDDRCNRIRGRVTGKKQ